MKIVCISTESHNFFDQHISNCPSFLIGHLYLKYINHIRPNLILASLIIVVV